MKELLTTIAKGLVEAPDQVMVDEDEPNEEGVIVYHIHVAESSASRDASPRRSVRLPAAPLSGATQR